MSTLNSCEIQLRAYAVKHFHRSRSLKIIPNKCTRGFFITCKPLRCIGTAVPAKLSHEERSTQNRLKIYFAEYETATLRVTASVERARIFVTSISTIFPAPPCDDENSCSASLFVTLDKTFGSRRARGRAHELCHVQQFTLHSTVFRQQGGTL